MPRNDMGGGDDMSSRFEGDDETVPVVEPPSFVVLIFTIPGRVYAASLPIAGTVASVRWRAAMPWTILLVFTHRA